MAHELVTIAFSHYCEKARWALDRFGVTYREHRMMPFLHMPAVYRRARGGGRKDRASSPLSTPLLVTEDGERLHDSSDILRWVDGRHAGGSLYPTDEAGSLERRFGDELGPHSRRLGYFLLLGQPALLAEMARRNVSPTQAAIARAALPVAVFGLRRALAVDEEGAARSEAKVRAVVDEVADRLADGRPYLLGDAFSAADLTFAALLAPLVLPPEYGAWFPEPSRIGPRADALVGELRAHPAGAFALRMFAEERAARDRAA